MYLQARMTYRQLYLVRAALQMTTVWLAICLCLTRISDYMHHWTDSAGGAVLGVSVAVFVVSTVFCA